MSLVLRCMSQTQKKITSAISAKSLERSARKTAKRAAKKTTSALAVISDRLPAAPRLVKRARATVKSLSGRTNRLVRSNPLRVLLGAAALGFVFAKLKHLV
ncbi:MAG TPA: hypothetical protein VN853_16780 [Polyangia bacterium]|nr:hypothetical protein [Polyangia bacterium]